MSNQIKISFPDSSVKEYKSGISSLEIAKSISWLLTDAPDNFTGQVLHLDGGMSEILV